MSVSSTQPSRKRLIEFGVNEFGICNNDAFRTNYY